MEQPMTIRSVATQREDKEGYIVLLDAGDLAAWLRSDLHSGLSEWEVKLVRELADHIDMFAMGVLLNETDLV